MLIKKVINEKFVKVIFAGFISYYFGIIILQSNFKAAALLGLAVFIILFFTKLEYVFYFLLASRSIVDIFYSTEAMEGTRLTHFIGGLIGFLFIYYSVVVSRHNFYHILNLGINKIYVSFLLLSIPAIFFTESLTVGIGYWFRLFQGFLFFNITILLVTSVGNELFKKKINIICWSVIFSVILPLYYFLTNYIQGITVVGSGDIARYSTFAAHYNVFSYLLFIVFTFCLFLYSESTKNTKKILFIFLAILILTISATYTRNIWLGTVILLLAYNVIRKNFMITFSTLVFLILVIIFIPDVQDRFHDIYIILTSKDFFELKHSLGSSRIGTWQAHIRYFFDHSTLIEKLFGNGYQIYKKIKIPPYNLFNQSHNNYLTLLMSTGIFGLSFYLLYILKLFQESFKLLKRTKEIYLRNLAQVFISLLSAYVIISMQTHILWFISIQYYFSVFAGFVIAAKIIEERNKMEIGL